MLDLSRPWPGAGDEGRLPGLEAMPEAQRLRRSTTGMSGQLIGDANRRWRKGLKGITVSALKSVTDCGYQHDSIWPGPLVGHMGNDGECVRPKGHPGKQHRDRDGHLY